MQKEIQMSKSFLILKMKNITGPFSILSLNILTEPVLTVCTQLGGRAKGHKELCQTEVCITAVSALSIY